MVETSLELFGRGHVAWMQGFTDGGLVGGSTGKGLNGDSWLQYTTHSLPYPGLSCTHPDDWLAARSLKSSDPDSSGTAQATRHIGGGESS